MVTNESRMGSKLVHRAGTSSWAVFGEVNDFVDEEDTFGEGCDT